MNWSLGSYYIVASRFFQAVCGLDTINSLRDGREKKHKDENGKVSTKDGLLGDDSTSEVPIIPWS
jgi:hypothetical protein